MTELFSIFMEGLLLAPVPVLLLANAADAGIAAGRPRRLAGASITPGLARAVLALMPGAVGFLGAIDVIGGLVSAAARESQPAIVGTGAGLVAVAVLLAVILLPRTMHRVARVVPLDATSVTSQAALMMAIAVIGTQLVTQATTDVLGEAARAGRGLTRLDLVLGELPFLVAAVFGVGWLIRRDTGRTIRRLGLNLPPIWVLAGALAAAIAFLGFGIGMDWLAHQVTPGLARRVDAANSNLFGGLGDPVGILTIALAAGVCEEVLFRGAIQPRLGLLLTSLLFTSVHTQYGISFDALAVFVLALGLGLIRIGGGTTAAIATHVAYDALVGAGLGSWAWPGLVALGSVLLLVFLVGLILSRSHARGQGEAATAIDVRDGLP